MEDSKKKPAGNITFFRRFAYFRKRETPDFEVSNGKCQNAVLVEWSFRGYAVARFPHPHPHLYSFHPSPAPFRSSSKLKNWPKTSVISDYFCLGMYTSYQFDVGCCKHVSRSEKNETNSSRVEFLSSDKSLCVRFLGKKRF